MGIDLTDDQLGMFALHAAELDRWNRRINLTAITEPKEAAVKHFLDCIAPAGLIAAEGALLDLGTGGGFPGIPLKIIRPGLSVVLADAVEKKINFNRQVIRLLGLADITAFHCRLTPSERPPSFVQSFDTIICRAFSSISNFVSTAASLVAEGGQLIAMKGGNCDDELAALKHLEIPCDDGRFFPAYDIFTVNVRTYRLYHLQDRRTLVSLTRN